VIARLGRIWEMAREWGESRNERMRLEEQVAFLEHKVLRLEERVDELEKSFRLYTRSYGGWRT
jgi:exonuclease VII small subunit